MHKITLRVLSTCTLLAAGDPGSSSSKASSGAPMLVAEGRGISFRDFDEEEVDLIKKALLQPGGGAAGLLRSLDLKLGGAPDPKIEALLNATQIGLRPMLDNLVTAAANDTKMLNTLYAGFAPITHEFNKTKARALALRTEVTAARRAHADCRGHQHGHFTNHAGCNLQLDTLRKNFQVAQKELQNNAGTQLQDAFCPHASSGFKAASSGDFKDLAQAWEVEAKAQLRAKMAECQDHSSSHDTQKTECDQKQQALEEAVCRYGAMVKTACERYVQSWDVKLQNYNMVLNSTKLREANRVKEYEHIKRAMCVIEALIKALGHGDWKKGGKSHKDIEACHVNDFKHAGLAVAKRPAPPRRPCPARPPLPCSKAFARREYGGLPAEAGAAACAKDCASTGS